MTVMSVAFALMVGLAVIACGPAASPSPTSSPTAAAIIVPSAPPLPTASSTPSAVPTPAATALVTPSASAAACDVQAQTGLLPSDRLTGVEVLGTAGRDVVRFTFGEGSLEPAGPATGHLDVASPPFTEAGSGAPIHLRGEHAVQVVFTGMSLQNDVGQPTFDGQREIVAGDASGGFRHAVLFDESEGRIAWYIGYDGPGCVTLTREGDTIVLAIDSGPGS